MNLVRGSIEFDVETGIFAGAVAWLTDRRLVAALARGGIVLIDPATGAIVRRWEGWAWLDAATTRTRRRFVMLEPGRPVSRLVTVDRTGRLRSVALRLPLRKHDGQRETPALVADPVHEHVYILPGGRRAFDVDLRRMRVRRNRLRPALRGESQKRANPAALRYRQAIWLGDGRLAISGNDSTTRGRRVTSVPAGLSTVNTKSWRVREVDANAIGVALTPRRLLAYGQRGLRAYTLNGRRVFELLRNKPVWTVGTRGRLAYVATDRATRVIDTGSGRVRGRIPRALEVSAIARRCPTRTG